MDYRRETIGRLAQTREKKIKETSFSLHLLPLRAGYFFLAVLPTLEISARPILFGALSQFVLGITRGLSVGLRRMVDCMHAQEDAKGNRISLGFAAVFFIFKGIFEN